MHKLEEVLAQTRRQPLDFYSQFIFSPGPVNAATSLQTHRICGSIFIYKKRDQSTSLQFKLEATALKSPSYNSIYTDDETLSTYIFILSVQRTALTSNIQCAKSDLS